MGKCNHCLITTSTSYSHPTLGAVCPVCLHPKKSKKKKRNKDLEKKIKAIVSSEKPYITKVQKEIKSLEKSLEITGCRACGTTEDLTVDHIIPKAKRGQNTRINKQPLCTKCNGIKNDLLPGKNGWWPDCLLGYLDGGKIVFNAALKIWEDDPTN